MPARDSIRRRLQRLIVLTTGAVLLLTCSIFIFLEWRTSLATQKQFALSTARITADAASATLAFGIRADADKSLMAFRAEPNVLSATLYDAAGKVFAEYRAPGSGGPAPNPPRAGGLYVEHARLIVFQPVLEGEKRYGTLCLQTDLRGLYAGMARYGWIALLIFVGAMVAAFFIGRLLQETLSRPLLSLALTAQSISRQRDYSVRAPTAKGGELEILTTAFNQMLEEIQRQQEDLAKEKELLAITLASIGDAVIITNEQGRVRFLNVEAERLTGWKSTEAEGKTLPSVFHILNEATRQPVENPVDKVLRCGGVVGLANHTILIAKNGTELPIDDSAAPIRQAGGPLHGVVLVFRDFTERKLIEEKLRNLALLPEQNPEPVLRVALDGRLLFANQFALTRNFWNARVSELVPAKVAELVAQAFARKVPIEAELSEGQSLFSFTLVPCLDLGYANLYGRDVTESKRAQIELRHRERTQRLLANIGDLAGRVPDAGQLLEVIAEKVASELEVSRCGYARVDTAAGVITAEHDYHGHLPSLAGVFSIAEYGAHLKQDSLAGRMSVVDDLAAFPSTAPLYEAKFKPLNIRAHLHVPLHRHGRWAASFWVSHHEVRHWNSSEIELMRILADRVWTAVEHARTAAELRQAHQLLSDKATHLESLVAERTVKLQEMISELQHVSYAIVHDMRAPLRAMNTFADAVLEDISANPGSPPRLLDYCRRIILAASRLDKLIQDSLRYTKAVLLEVPLQPVDLSQLVPGLIETYPNLQPDKADIVIQSPLPVVMGEGSLLTQCFSNLLGNAVKFVPPGTRPHIRVFSEIFDGFVRLTIEDNGIGIPLQAQSRLFGMFQRLTADYEGTGIGLAIVRKVVERMGGKVGVESEPGKGSRFWVELRLPEASLPETSPRIPET